MEKQSIQTNKVDSVKLEVKNLSTSYRKFKISDISFELKNGDIMGLIGRSGSGKSTLMNTLLGIKKLDSGEINVFVNNQKVPLNTVVGYSPQDNSLYPYLTLEENIFTFGRLFGVPNKMIKDRLGTLLKRLELLYSKDKKIIELSGGMKKRADLVVTLIHNPKIIILDEPFTGLDTILQHFIWDLIKQLSQEGRIFIISSHLLEDIQKHCNEFGIIDQGTFYDSARITHTVKSKKEKSLEIFLERLFSVKS